METKEPFDDKDDLLPFSFGKDNIPESQIKAHWLKILEKISGEEAGSEKDQNNNTSI